MKSAYFLCAAALVSVFAFTGCSSKPTLYPVNGKVFQGDKPAAGAQVIFHPIDKDRSGAPKPIGDVDDHGDFTLKWDNQVGAPAGDYVVTIIWRLPKESPLSRDQPDILKGRYANPSTTLLRATVEKGPTELAVFRVD